MYNIYYIVHVVYIKKDANQMYQPIFFLNVIK